MTTKSSYDVSATGMVAQIFFKASIHVVSRHHGMAAVAASCARSRRSRRYYLPSNRIGQRTAAVQASSHRLRTVFDLDIVADTETDLPHMVPTAGRFERLVGSLGINNQSRVVFYDQKGIFSSPRGWWMFKLFGHDQAFVLDGGLPKWRAEGRRVECASEAHEVEAQIFRATFRSGLLRGTGDLLRNIETADEKVIDARSAARFEGSVPEPRTGVARGHIPGSVNLPFSSLLNSDQTFKDTESLRTQFSKLRIAGTDQLVASCGTGVTAAVVALGAELAGLRPVAIYDGSWTEWGGRIDTPKENSVNC
jgi:thiosulfate/3-mercaptopyruvate sulfurtransferase